MTTTLPKTITLQSNRGDREVKVLDLGSTSVPDNDGGRFRHQLFGSHVKGQWDGHYAESVKPHLATWSFPREVKETRDRAEQVLEELIPNQKRSMLRNQRHGLLDQKWVPSIAIGEDIERPFQRWSKNKRETISVAICLDSSVACYQSPELLKSRMVLAAGLASALEVLDYEVAIIGAHAQIAWNECDAAIKPRQNTAKAEVLAITCKDWNEPFCDGGLAHFADTGLRRLIGCWQQKSNFFATSLTDLEWRELTQADLLIYVGPKAGTHAEVLNSESLPRGATLGPKGDDVLRLEADRLKHIDPAIDKLATFFQERFGD